MQRRRVRGEEARADDLALLAPGEGGELEVDGVVGQHVHVGDAHLGVVADQHAPEGVDALGAEGELGLLGGGRGANERLRACKAQCGDIQGEAVRT